MASTATTTILEQCLVAPSPGSEAKLSLPLTFFDMPWLHFHVIQRLLFYGFPCSKAHFIDTIVPDIKNSLSIALKNFLPLAGSLIYPLDDSEPEIRYTSGDTVSITFAESSNDFNHLTMKHPRNADEFHPLVPQLPPVRAESGYKIIPLLALQVTLFPDVGICIGYVNHHVVGDASTIVGFIRSWAKIHKLGGDADLIAGNLLPSYDRSVIKDPRGLGKALWNEMKNIKVEETQQISLPADKVRATYVIDRDQIQMLKNLVLSERPTVAHLSSFTVTLAYVWTCLVRSTVATGKELEGDEYDNEYIICSVDCRARLDPPAPANYFGNCLAPCILRSTRKKLMENEGLLIAAESIGETIHNFVNSEGGIMTGADTWIDELKSILGGSVLGVAGSPKFDIYATDYGWGKPKTYEAVSIDMENGVSFSKSREYEGGLEVGLSLPKTRMDAFASVFADGFKIDVVHKSQK